MTIENLRTKTLGQVYLKKIHKQLDKFPIAIINDDKFLMDYHKVSEEFYNSVDKRILTITWMNDEPVEHDGKSYKYMIIVPSSMDLNNLTFADAEILLHELGHIRYRAFTNNMSPVDDFDKIMACEITADKNIISQRLFIHILEYMKSVLQTEYFQTMLTARIEALQSKLEVRGVGVNV